MSSNILKIFSKNCYKPHEFNYDDKLDNSEQSMLLSRQLTFMSRLIQPAKLATRAYHMPTATSRLYRVPVRLFCTAQTKINP